METLRGVASRAALVWTGIVAISVTAERASAQAPLRRVLDPPPVPGAGPQRVTAGPEYRAGSLHRFFLGDGYRDLWTTPLVVPVLDLRKEAHGLRPIRVGGGFQTQTIHLRGGDDGYYLFRSINKAVRKGLDPELQGTPAGLIVQDQTSALHPAGAWVVAPLLDAVGVPNTPPRIFVMPNDPILGEYREQFAGILGMLVESPDKGESGTKRFEGSVDIQGSEELIERLRSSAADRVDSRNLLASRLIDFIVGDPDRNFDNFRWIAFESAGGRIWRAVPMDRDPAFLKADGFLAWIARRSFIPKLVDYGPDYDDVYGLWASQPEMDRLLLADLDRPTWDSTVAAVQAGLTDRVLDAAVAALPDEYERLNGAFLASSMRVRREELPWAAARFYEALAREVDVQATSGDDVAEVVHGADGTVSVALHGDCARLAAYRDERPGGGWVCTRTYYERRLLPSETREVRIYLREGNDRAVVRGDGPQLLWVRVMGGPGNDILEDDSRATGTKARTAFYDHEGDNTFAPAPGTRVVRAAFDGRVITDFVFEDKSSTFRDYGGGSMWLPVGGHDASAGLIGGIGWRSTAYGFRRDPWASRLDVTGLIGMKGGFGGDIELRRRLEGSPMLIEWHARATQDLWSYRFFGYGNDTPLVNEDRALVPADEALAEGGLGLDLGDRGDAFIGPRVKYLNPDPDPLGPLAESGLDGSGPYGQVGLAGDFDFAWVDDLMFPRKGVALLGDASVYAPVWDVPEWFGGAGGEVRAYLPLPFRSTLASRAGGAVAWGDFPVQESVFLGGRRILRGFKRDRFAGDGSLYGSTELRVRLFPLTLLTRGDLGALAFGDAGRVYMDGESPGGWHTSLGGGLWYRTMGVSGTLVYAVGEEPRVHAYLGLPF